MVDIGSNLLDSMFQGCYHGKQAHDPDLLDVLQRARRAGVVQQLVTAGSLAEVHQALDLVAQPGNGAFLFPWLLADRSARCACVAC